MSGAASARHSVRAPALSRDLPQRSRALFERYYRLRCCWDGKCARGRASRGGTLYGPRSRSGVPEASCMQEVLHCTVPESFQAGSGHNRTAGSDDGRTGSCDDHGAASELQEAGSRLQAWLYPSLTPSGQTFGRQGDGLSGAVVPRPCQWRHACTCACRRRKGLRQAKGPSPPCPRVRDLGWCTCGGDIGRARCTPISRSHVLPPRTSSGAQARSGEALPACSEPQLHPRFSS